jgi:hypothetical protein
MRLAYFAIGLLWTVCAVAETLYRVPWAQGAGVYVHAGAWRKDQLPLHESDVACGRHRHASRHRSARGKGRRAIEAHHGASAEEDPLSYEGNFVRVRHADRTAATYAHLKYRSVVVAVGETVAAGRLLAHSGATGDVTAPHLHFAVTRTEMNSSGWREDVSVPVIFYIGVPPVAFAPRAAATVTANYSTKAEAPRAASEGPAASKPPVLTADEEARAWWLLALWLACGAAALTWFWRFSRS